jgi:outer membrane lipoprotein-sorting protein
MRRILGLIALGGLVAVAMAQVNGAAVLSNFAKALNSAKTVSSDYTVQIIGNAADDYSITFEKPNKARIDTPTQLVIADGNEITTYDKLAKTYYTKPQTDSDLKALLASDELSLFSGFFNEGAYSAASVKNLGEKNRKGQSVTAVQTSVDKDGKKVITYFVGKDHLARAAQTDLNDPSGVVRSMLDTKTLTLDGNVPENTFAFNAPDGARKISLDELNAEKWYTDIDEAMKVAASSNRKIFVDFMATWCGPCKMLDREVLTKPEFKKYSSKLVLLRIDVDAQTNIAAQYKIEAMPTQMVLDARGSVLGQTVGYGGPAPFFKWLDGIVGRP